MTISVVLLAGGTGLRMGNKTPKQYLSLGSQPIALHSFQVFASSPQISEIIVVCDPSYRELFPSSCLFADPGARRQDSLANGFQIASSDYILVHDAARPFIDCTLIDTLIEAGRLHGAAAPALPVKLTLKRAQGAFVVETLNRAEIYEMQTPQIIRADLLAEGLRRAEEFNISVTDDVAFAELLGHPVKLVEGLERNLKITTPLDLKVAEMLLNEIQAFA